MAGQSGDDYVLRDWLKKQLESGDGPEILKTVLKNRGINPDIVDSVRLPIKKGAKDTPAIVAPIQPKKEFVDSGLKNEADSIRFSSDSPDTDADSMKLSGGKVRKSEAKAGACSSKNNSQNFKKETVCEEKIPEKTDLLKPQQDSVHPKQAQQLPEESLFSLFIARIRDYLSGMKFTPPKIIEYLFDARIVVLAGIAVAIILFALLASFGLNWYADWAARSVLQ